MTCEEALALLSARLDGQLGAEEAAALEAHLASCPRCRALAAELEGLDKNLMALKEPAPEGLKQGVLYRIDRASGKTKTRGRWFRPGTALGAVAALLVLLVGTGLIKLPSQQSKADGAVRAETEAPGYAEDKVPNKALEPNAKPEGTDVWIIPHQEGSMDAPPENPADTVELALPSFEVSNDVPWDSSLVQETTKAAASVWESHVDMTVLHARCEALSEKEDALVLAYADIDPDSLFALLEQEAPELYQLTAELEPQEENGLLLYPTDCGTALALQEWLTAQIDANGETVRGASLLTETLERLDPDSENLNRVIRVESPSHVVAWPQSWPGTWALELQKGSNWILRYPSEDYVPKEDAPAYLVFAADP